MLWFPKRRLTPIELHRLEQARMYRATGRDRVHPIEWVAIFALLLSVVGGGAWMSLRVAAWATSSPTAKVLMPNYTP
jgi:hypothetical protein